MNENPPKEFVKAAIVVKKIISATIDANDSANFIG